MKMQKTYAKMRGGQKENLEKRFKKIKADQSEAKGKDTSMFVFLFF